MNQILKCEIAMTPPSVNHYWLSSGKRRYISEKGREFQDLDAVIVTAKYSEKRLKMHVMFHFPNKVRRDIDNHLKALLDSLVKAGLCLDDEQFDEINVKRGNIVKGGLVELEVWEL